MKCQSIMGLVEKLAPKRLAESWDNPGLLVGSPHQDVKRIMVCLDLSLEVAEAAIERQVDMIISHHPVLFRGIKSIRTDSYDGLLLQKLLSNNIAVYAAHTNLDVAVGGCNDVLAEKLGLQAVEGFVATDPDTEDSLGRIGCLNEEMDASIFAKYVCDCLGASHVRLVKSGQHTIRKVAICTGSGAEFISKAAFKGAEAYVTSDVKYHEAQQAVKQGIHLVDAGHFATEYPMVKVVAEYLRQEISKTKHDVQVFEDELSQDFFEAVCQD